MTNEQSEVYISVDVEAAGPFPGEYSMLSIGACTIYEPRETFYTELKPINDNASLEALLVSRLSMTRLKERGLEPTEAMTRFDTWVTDQAGPDQQPVLVAFNAPFDWMFINYYFHRYLGRNPFGHSALDIKAFYMGLSGVLWSETTMRYISPRYLGDRQLTHHALRDALDQADIFEQMLEEAKDLRGQSD